MSLQFNKKLDEILKRADRLIIAFNNQMDIELNRAEMLQIASEIKELATYK